MVYLDMYISIVFNAYIVYVLLKTAVETWTRLSYFLN